MSTLVHDNYPTIIRLLNAEIDNTSIRVTNIAKIRVVDRHYFRVRYHRHEDPDHVQSNIRTDPEHIGEFPTQAVLAKLRLLA